MSNTSAGAVKRWRHPGDPRAYGDWIVAQINLTASEAGYLEACKTLIEATADMGSLLNLGDGSAATHYKIVFSRDESRIHERDFFVSACKFRELRPYVAQYVRNVNTGRDEYWQDEYHTAGSYAIAELVLADENYAPLLGEMLFVWDMGHETYQRDLIDIVFERYGLTNNTLALLASRCFADGQSIEENIWHALYPIGFKEIFNLERFAELAITLPANNFDFGFQTFATLYGGTSDNDYHRAIKIFSKALYALEKGKLIDWTEMRNEVIHPELEVNFTPHHLMDDGDDFWGRRSEDWNEGLYDAEVESTNWEKIAEL